MDAKDKAKQLLEESQLRRSYRQFLDEPVDLDVIRDCIRTAANHKKGL